ncbi:hypothetical protein [Deinococcus multiflagellatus]|uniref:Endonuclease/exonuclease/phosphatase domain-containing protein n=1 Tax=Deinococcus multiflagellatus TaxID=1656887 RepID=A0ABW1ZLR8_9DEIO
MERQSSTDLSIPPVASVNSSFIMGEVPGKTFVGAWRVKTDAEPLQAPASLLLKTEATVSAQVAGNRITEVFLRDNTDGHVILVGSFKNGAALSIEDFGDRINEERGGPVDLTYFAYMAPQGAYDAACLKEGGSTSAGYCSFAGKQIARKDLGTQHLSAQGQSLRVISWNLGNVAQSCSTSTGGANYNFKLCYTSTLRRISDQILGFEQARKPDILFFQEVWHGDCRYTSESWYGTYMNQRLCASNARQVNALELILGPSGSRYNYRCTAKEVIPATGLVVNGYECVAVNVNVLKFSALSPTQPENVGVHPNCEAVDSTRNYKGRDTGYQVANVTRLSGGNALTLINAHLSGTVDKECRQRQLSELETNTYTAGKPFTLLAGDWNTEPTNDSTVGGQAYRETFAGPWTSATPTLASSVDDPTQDTAFYVHDALALDHVLSNSFTGSCTRGPNFDGTDHTWTDCSVGAQAF